MNKKSQAFPSRFLWGAASAAHQVEGGLHNQWSVWELENAKVNAVQAEHHINDFPAWERIESQAKDPNNYISGSATNHAQRYEEDFDLLESMNMNAYRFSIEWSRIEPREGVWDAEAIAYYKKYIASLKKRGIEPILTLMHFTLPVWFAEKGGWEKRSNIRYFVRYAEHVMREIGGSVRYIVTINEPEVYGFCSYRIQEWPPQQSSTLKAFLVIYNQTVAHRKVVKVLKKINSRYKIGIAKNSVYMYPGDSSWLSGVSASVMQYLQDDLWLSRVVSTSDFIGLNYYMSQRVLGYRIHNPENADYSDLNWKVSPEDIEFVLERWHTKYKKPILITENGIADNRDAFRKEWIEQTIRAMQRAMKRDVKILGYMHWSLTDNFEWAYGKWPRFGLAAVDYTTGTRTLRPSARWFGRVIKKIRGV
jgi:beta-glucosidase